MAQQSKRGRGRTLDQWRSVFAEQTASGQNQQAFCRARDISVAAFYNAKARAKAEHGSMVAPVRDEFVAVSLAPLPSELPSTRSDAWDIELSLGPDVVLRLRRG